VQGRPAGAWGDYAIGSSMKFYPTYEGGCLVSARHPLRAPSARSAGVGFEAKAALGALERAFGYGRLTVLERLLALPMALKRVLWNRAKVKAGGAQADAPRALAPDSSDSSVRFEPAWLDRRSALFSRAVLRMGSARRIVQQRRANYLRLAAALAGLPGCRPLHPALPEGVCPWVFPLLAEDPEPLFAALKARGVPLVRFAEVRDPAATAADFPRSAALVSGVLGFPVHQELRPDELAWLCATIREAAGA
jgi:dTDP-4-amino-4,6-dideoxygalactose transaminase